MPRLSSGPLRWATSSSHHHRGTTPGRSFLRERGVPEEHWNDRSAVVDPAGAGPRLFLQKVPEPKTVKNRVHIDLQVGAGLPPGERPARVAAEVERLLALGATHLRAYDEMGEHWVVLQDPEGNEFCVS